MKIDTYQMQAMKAAPNSAYEVIMPELFASWGSSAKDFDAIVDCQQRFQEKMNEKGVTQLIPDTEVARKLLGR